VNFFHNNIFNPFHNKSTDMSVLRLLTNSDAVILNDSEESHLY